MASKEYDIIIFGASGFTGQFAVEDLARVAEHEGIKWAIAGRSMSKLQAVLAEASKRTGKDLEDLPIVMADVSSEQSILEMCGKARVIINCVGPYTKWGDRVVRACIEQKTHHVDISGEPKYLENTQLLYNGKAKEKGIYIIGACGFDSIPAEMGLKFVENNFPGDLNSVENYVSFKSGPEGDAVNTGTWESAILSFGDLAEIKHIRRQLMPNRIDYGKFLMPKRSPVFFSEQVNGYCVPFPQVDKSVIRRTMNYRQENKQKPVQFEAHLRVPGLLAVGVMALFASVVFLLAKFSFGRSLLIRFPTLFSGGMFKKGGPTRKQVDGCSFNFTMVGTGWEEKADVHTEKPTKEIVCRVSGPSAGYTATVSCIVSAAICILKEADKMPQGGGVLTPGAAFANTSIIDRLEKSNIHFQVVKK